MRIPLKSNWREVTFLAEYDCTMPNNDEYNCSYRKTKGNDDNKCPLQGNVNVLCQYMRDTGFYVQEKEE